MGLNMNNIKYYYAERIHETWPKLFILTDDGTLYCEYLDNLNPTIFTKQVDYLAFDASDFKWGGYQAIIEIDQISALNTSLTRQSNWVSQYLKTL